MELYNKYGIEYLISEDITQPVAIILPMYFEKVSFSEAFILGLN